MLDKPFYKRGKSGLFVAITVSMLLMYLYVSKAGMLSTSTSNFQTKTFNNSLKNGIFWDNSTAINFGHLVFSARNNAIGRNTQNKTAIIQQRLAKGNGTYRLSKPAGVQQLIQLNGQTSLTWSQYGQDILVNDFFHKRREGFFVEIGGYNGETNSNTLLLEKHYGWKGLLVEANPYLYKQMLEKDRKCYMINCCISNDEPEMTFLLADALTAADNVLSKEHKDRIDKEENTSISSMHYGESVKTQCFSLMDILDVIGRRHIDYFSLDVEGGEMYILKSIDFDKLDITYFTIETDQHRDDILKFMEEKGYEHRHHLMGDDTFRKTFRQHF